jgi:hypothetical protein
MHITDFIWLAQFIDKLEHKHGVSTNEVEDVFANEPRIQSIQRGM